MDTGIRNIKFLKFYNYLFKMKQELYRFSTKCKLGKLLFDILYEKFSKSELKEFKYNLSIAAIMQNEGLYIKEWLEYHKLVGIDKIYLYDNDSTDNTFETIKPYIDSGFVTYHKFGGKKMQLVAYEHAVKSYKNETKWLAIVDLDEFIYPVTAETVPEVLKDYENECGIRVCCVDYDSNDFLKRQEGLVIENYTRRDKKVSFSCKSISNPRKIKFCNSAHFAIYYKDEMSCDENFKKLAGAQCQEPSAEKIRINHYFCKSFEEHQIKCGRFMADIGKRYDQPKKPFVFENSVQDHSMDKYISKLKNVC